MGVWPDDRLTQSRGLSVKEGRQSETAQSAVQGACGWGLNPADAWCEFRAPVRNWAAIRTRLTIHQTLWQSIFPLLPQIYPVLGRRHPRMAARLSSFECLN